MTVPGHAARMYDKENSYTAFTENFLGTDHFKRRHKQKMFKLIFGILRTYERK
jgi:hypothetical protein